MYSFLTKKRWIKIKVRKIFKVIKSKKREGRRRWTAGCGRDRRPGKRVAEVARQVADFVGTMTTLPLLKSSSLSVTSIACFLILMPLLGSFVSRILWSPHPTAHILYFPSAATHPLTPSCLRPRHHTLDSPSPALLYVRHERCQTASVWDQFLYSDVDATPLGGPDPTRALPISFSKINNVTTY